MITPSSPTPNAQQQRMPPHQMQQEEQNGDHQHQQDPSRSGGGGGSIIGRFRRGAYVLFCQLFHIYNHHLLTDVFLQGPMKLHCRNIQYNIDMENNNIHHIQSRQDYRPFHHLQSHLINNKMVAMAPMIILQGIYKEL
jgi:hypothetical protein